MALFEIHVLYYHCHVAPCKIEGSLLQLGAVGCGNEMD